MGHPNEDVVRRGYDAFSGGDMETLREVFHPDAVWHAPGRGQLSGDDKGVHAERTEVWQFWGDRYAADGVLG